VEVGLRVRDRDRIRIGIRVRARVRVRVKIKVEVKVRPLVEGEQVAQSVFGIRVAWGIRVLIFNININIDINMLKQDMA